MNTYLVISALGSDKPGIVDSLAKQAVRYNCNIEDSRMTVLGGEFAIIMLIKGSETDIKQLIKSCPELEAQLGLTITTKITLPRAETSNCQPYCVEVIALDNPGIVHELSNFFSRQNINIEDLRTGTYAAAHTGTAMFNLSMMVILPPEIKVSKLRDDFLNYCDERNLDATIEPNQ